MTITVEVATVETEVSAVPVEISPVMVEVPAIVGQIAAIEVPVKPDIGPVHPHIVAVITHIPLIIADVSAVVALLTDDVFISMPPMPLEYQGRDVVLRFCAGLFGAGRRYDLVRTRANRQPAFGAYLRAPTGIRHGVGLYVLTLSGDRICAMTRFENSVLPWFELARSLPAR